ncbi:MAG: relaxase/mobilization nuclease domain-containing protein [Geminicoccaceae bacterium]
MILKASQRAGGTQLALHLLNDRDNDHVELHELRGFISDNLVGAFKEAYAISTGTKCQQFLFSLSLSPPERETVPVEDFENAIAEIEEKMSLSGQPRAIIFHEKEGRRHAHCVWSRINTIQMKAINLPHFKLKLRDMSRQLSLEYDWKMPRGLMNSAEQSAQLHASRMATSQACETRPAYPERNASGVLDGIGYACCLQKRSGRTRVVSG